jgi:serine/threonine protein kinase
VVGRLLNDVIAGRFEIASRVASGGMGGVYRGVDRTTGATVAVKIVSKRDAPRFARECELLSQVSHPAIVGYVAHGQVDEEQLFLAMEWIEGETLEQRLARGAMSIDGALEVARQLAGGLAAVHALGVVHRDVKPSDVVISGTQARLVDFGIAWQDDAPHLTESGFLVGSPGYMAPEQVRAQRDIACIIHVHAVEHERVGIAFLGRGLRGAAADRHAHHAALARAGLVRACGEVDM